MVDRSNPWPVAWTPKLERLFKKLMVGRGSTGLGGSPRLDDIIVKSPWIDVRAFGAVGDGIADDTTAIQAAIDAASPTKPKSVFLPPGDYLISSSLLIYEGISFGGAPDTGGRWNRGGAEHRAVRIIWDGNNASPAIFLAGTAATSIAAWQLEGIYLHDFLLIPVEVKVTGGGYTTGGQDGITINGSQAGTYPDASRKATFDILIERVSARNFARNNYRLEGNVFDVRLNNCAGQAAGDDGFETVNIVSDGLNHPGQVHFLDCYMSSNIEDKWAMDLDACTGASISGGGIAGIANGVTISSYGFIDGAVNFEGSSDDLNKIGLRLMGQGTNICASITGYTVDLQIGNSGAENINGWNYSGGILKGTTGLLVTAGGNRSGIFHEPNWDPSITTRINNAAFDIDGIQFVNFISNQRILSDFAADATPDVFLKDRITLSGVATVTDFDNPTEGQILLVLLMSDTIDFTHSANLRLMGSISWTTGISGDSTSFVRKGGAWYEINRHLKASETYTETNVTTDRAFDADTVNVAELADVVGTLIADLRAKAIVK